MTKILIVEDNPQSLYMLEVLLKTNGFEVDQAVNGKEALEIARKSPPDIVISDILMPTMDGFSFCRIWKTDDQLKAIPFIIYTATYTDKKDEEFALSLGAERFVIKPREPEELLHIVREELDMIERKKRAVHRKPIQEGEEYYKGYNEALIRKLESKMIKQDQLNKRLNALYRVSTDIVSIKPANDLIRRIINEIASIIGYHTVIYFSFDEKKNTLSVGDAVGIGDESTPQFIEKLESTLQNEKSLARMAVKSGEVINIKNTATDPRWLKIDDSIKSAIFIPVQYEEQVLGVLGLYSSDLDSFTEDEQNLVTLANSLAISINNKRTQDELIAINNTLEDRIEERTEQLQTSNKDLEAFAYTISHDLRAPLRAIDGYTKILIEECKGVIKKDNHELLDQVVENVSQMDLLITDVLALSRVGIVDKKISRIDMNELVKTAFQEVSTDSVRDRISFKMEKLPEADGDKILIQQVWRNLLSNAVKFSFVKPEPSIQIDGIEKDHEIIYSVKDNGVGFDQQIAHDLYVPFQREQRDIRFETTGVGLAIVKRIIERHGGKVWCEGVVDEGACFYFSLPKKQPI